MNRIKSQPRFKIFDVVKIIDIIHNPLKYNYLIGKYGILDSDPEYDYTENDWGYGVFIEEFQEGFCFYEKEMQFTGKSVSENHLDYIYSGESIKVRVDSKGQGWIVDSKV